MSRPATLDFAAIGLSGLCLVHCLALPLLAASLPLLGTWSEAEWLHLALVLAAAPISLFALMRPGSRGLPWGLVALAWLGVGALTAGALGWPRESSETLITVAGSLLLATAHVLNWRRSRHPHGCQDKAVASASRD